MVRRDDSEKCFAMAIQEIQHDLVERSPVHSAAIIDDYIFCETTDSLCRRTGISLLVGALGIPARLWRGTETTTTLVGALGIEPRLNGPKPLVLPLYYAPFRLLGPTKGLLEAFPSLPG